MDYPVEHTSPLLHDADERLPAAVYLRYEAHADGWGAALKIGIRPTLTPGGRFRLSEKSAAFFANHLRTHGSRRALQETR